MPNQINLDGNKATHRGLRLLGKEDCRWRAAQIRARRYLNNVVEQDHRAIKQRCASMRGLKSFRSAAITLAGIELAHRIRKGQHLLALDRHGRVSSLKDSWDCALSQACKPSPEDIRCSPSMHQNSAMKDLWQEVKPVRKTVPVTLLLTHSADQEGPWEGLRIAQWLAMRGCNIKAARADGDTLLHIAAEAGDAEFVRYLLAQGFDPSTAGQFKLPALGGTQDENVALILLEAGTDLSRMDESGKQFRRYAEENHWKRVMDWLEVHNR